MSTILLRIISVAGALCALSAASVSAQLIEFHAAISGTQETPSNSSTGSGTAVLLYDMSANTFDLMVRIDNLTSTITASHLHEGAPGVAGSIVTNLGSEAVYTRSGNSVTATFSKISHGGAKLTLLQNGDYINFHSAAFPGGEVRGQLIAQPKRLVANFSVAQEQAAFPATTITGVANGSGAAIMTYDPGANRVNLRISIYNFPNTLTNSHYHEGAPGVSGPVVTGLGNGTSANYIVSGNNITGTFLNLPYTGDPIKLLTGGAYLNFHSNVFPNGELRGQVSSSEEVLGTRLVAMATRGFVGTGSQVLIGGIAINGPEPVRLLITAKGPSLSAVGVAGALADPILAIYDSSGRQIALNDNIGTPAAGSELATLPGVPTNSAESALLVILPPGGYTAIVSGAAGSTGVALLEAVDLRNSSTVSASSSGTVASLNARSRALAAIASEFKSDLRLAAARPDLRGRAAPEVCALPALSSPTSMVADSRQ